MKYAIQINRNYDGLELKPHYRIASKSKTEALIKQYNIDVIDLQEEIRNEERFLKYPEITFEQHEPRPHPENSDCLILATASARYMVKIHKRPISVFPIIVVTICILFITFAIFVLQFAKKSHERGKIIDACYMYTKNGVPSSITVNGHDYKLNPDGTMDGMDKIFLNPYDEIDLARAECIRVNMKE